MEKKKSGVNPKLLDILNQTLALEYTLIIHYPRIADGIRDAETKRLAQSLGTAAISHADTVANAIKRLGGVPNWSFEPFAIDLDLKKTFRTQLAKEMSVLELHKQIAGMVKDSSIRDTFKELAIEDEGRVEIVERVLARLLFTNE